MIKKTVFAGIVCLLLISTASCLSNRSNNTKTPVIELTLPLIEAVPPVPVTMVYFDGPLLNIFFHQVIAWPEIAFASSYRADFLEWYVTADEYRRVLYELYSQGYVLVDIGEFFEVVYKNGIRTMTTNRLLVPEGKKPMVISFDDINFYEHTRLNGFVHKLVIDEYGEIAAWTDNGNGGELSYDKDVVTILENFIRQHPGFSIRGARGIIALTGYEGVLGHHTHRRFEGIMGNPTQRINDPEYQKKVENAKAVANRLKEMGWRFASHSWGHPNLPRICMAWFINDANRWDREVRPIIGDTNLFIYPFGAGVENDEERHRMLRDRGFNVFFGVGPGRHQRIGNGYLFLDRRNIDGFYFREFRNRPDRLFDIERVIDKEARGIKN